MDLVKTCSKCGEVKPIDAFAKNQRWCKQCKAAYHASSYAANREKFIARNKAWCAANPEKSRAMQRASLKAYYAANHEKALAYQRTYYAANPERCGSTQKAWRKKLTDAYIKILLTQGTPIKEVPQSLIDLTRLQVSIKRKLKELKDANDSNGSTR